MRTTIIAATIAAAVAALPAVVAADDESNIKYRQSVMKSIGGHAGAVGLLAKGAVPHAGHVTAHTSAIAELSKLVADAFRERTNTGDDTDATAKVWDNWADFEEKAKAFEQAAADLAAAGSNAGPKLKPLFDSCKACHKDFRKPKN